MTSDRDIYTAANMVIRMHGDDALTHSLRRLAQMVDAGDWDGGIVWGRIQTAIIELQDMEPGTLN